MTLRVQITIGAIAILAILLICNMIRKNKIDLRYSLIWIIVIGCVVVLDLWPGLLGTLARAMGIEVPINMLFFLGFCFSLIIIFGLSRNVSDLSEKVKKLTQELALVKEEIDQEKKDLVHNNKE